MPTISLIRPTVEIWVKNNITAIHSAIYAANYDALDRFEASILQLLKSIEQNVKKLVEKERTIHYRGFDSPSQENDFEVQVQDANQALDRIFSIRAPGCHCPVRTKKSQLINALKVAGMIRAEQWTH